MAICGDINGLGVAVEKLENIRWRRRVDDGSSDKLIHGLVVGRLGGIVDETGAADIDGSREESHAERLLVGNALESADEIGALEILRRESK